MKDCFGNMIRFGEPIYVVTIHGKKRKFKWEIDASQCAFHCMMHHIPYSYQKVTIK